MKKISVLLLAVFVLTTAVFCVFADTTRGDMNGDGKVDSDDAVYLLYHTFWENEYKLTQSGDVNGDGKVDASDAIHLLFHLFYPSDYVLSIEVKDDDPEGKNYGPFIPFD